MKSYQIYIIILCAVNLFNLVFVPDFMSNIGFDIIGIGIILFFIAFSGKKSHPLLTPSKKLVNFIFLGILLSAFSCYFFHSQKVISTLISQRSIYFLLVYYFFISIRPTKNEVFIALKWFAITYFIIWLYQYIVFPNMIVKIEEERLSRFISFDKRGIMLSGKLLILMFYYWSLEKILEKRSLMNILFFTGILIVFILNDNRGTLFPILILTSIISFKIKGRYRLVAWIFTFISFFVLIFQFVPQLTNLYAETINDFERENNARLISFYYWLFYPENIFEVIFGSGVDSLKSNYGLEISKLKIVDGIYRSDLGLIGFWSYFGLISTIPIYILIFKIIKNRKIYPLFLMLLSLHILSVPIAFVFWKKEGAVFLGALFYLYDLAITNKYLTNKNANKK